MDLSLVCRIIQTLFNWQAPLVFESDHQCSVAVGQLWVELLRFYALEFNLADLVISIRLKEKVSRESKDWPKKRIAVEGIWNLLTCKYIE